LILSIVTVVTQQISSSIRDFGITAALFPGGLFKNATKVSRKSWIIQPIRLRLQSSWSVSHFVCQIHQTFSQCSVGV